MGAILLCCADVRRRRRAVQDRPQRGGDRRGARLRGRHLPGPTGDPAFTAAIQLARIHSPAEALAARFLDEVVDVAAVRDRAVEVAAELGTRLHRGPFRVTRETVRVRWPSGSALSSPISACSTSAAEAARLRPWTSGPAARRRPGHSRTGQEWTGPISSRTRCGGLPRQGLSLQTLVITLVLEERLLLGDDLQADAAASRGDLRTAVRSRPPRACTGPGRPRSHLRRDVAERRGQGALVPVVEGGAVRRNCGWA